VICAVDLFDNKGKVDAISGPKSRPNKNVKTDSKSGNVGLSSCLIKFFLLSIAASHE
jgi:hypothetical protein